MNVLGIETSCDETAAAVVTDGLKLLSSVVASQDEIHQPFGGIVPELASRQHIVSILPVVNEALSKAGLTLDEIDGIAVTHAPGLIGSLLVGLSMAKALAFSKSLPMVGVHHIEGHLASVLLGEKKPKFPAIGLVTSGGHTNLYRMDAPEKYRLLGETIDDAAGEAFDKVAKLCQLGYPGGPIIDKMAAKGDPNAIPFTRPYLKGLDFSFSGLKTAVAVWIQKNGLPSGQALNDLAASFQETVVDVLITKLVRAAKEEGTKEVLICGGVAQNSRFRQKLTQESEENGLSLAMAPPKFCTDNAAMIALAGYPRLARGESDNYDLSAEATLPIASS